MIENLDRSDQLTPDDPGRITKKKENYTEKNGIQNYL